MIAGLQNFVDLLSPYLSDTDSQQQNSWNLLMQKNNRKIEKILDFGSGDGSTILFDQIKNGNMPPLWIGLDIQNKNKNELIQSVTYNGFQIPFKNSSFDIVYSHQVLEHVRFPDQIVTEIIRILKPGGLFIGSVSHTEPYHAESIFNWTPYGLVVIFRHAGIKDIRIYPGIDGLTLFFRRLTFGKLGNSFFIHESPVNILISFLGWVCRKPHREINAMKLALCGQVCFVASKGTGSPNKDRK